MVDCGHGLTYCVPVYEGYAIPHAIQEMPVAGSDLTQYMFEMLSKGVLEGMDDDTFVFDLEYARTIKEQFCVVA